MIFEPDFGTPASQHTDQVNLEIDGRLITVPAATSIMRAALEAGIDIPKLCSTDRLKAFG
jgi:formate dehydrogenase major subunit